MSAQKPLKVVGGKYHNGLPFGGFPSIEAYRFAR